MESLGLRTKAILRELPEVLAECQAVIEAQRDRIAELEASMTAERLPEFLTVADVATRIHVSKPHVYELCRQGSIHGLQSGRKWIIPAEAVNEYLQRQLRIVS